MNWSDERYIRVFTRDSADWLALDWDGQAVLVQLLRRADRAGIVELGAAGLRALPAILGHRDRVQEVERGIEQLLSLGTVVLKDGLLVIPNFIRAQEDKVSDAARQRALRERRRDQALHGLRFDGHAGDVTPGVTLGVTPGVTQAGHAGDVTPSFLPSVPSEEALPSAAPPAPRKAKKGTAKPPDPRTSEARALLESVHVAVLGRVYDWQGVKDNDALRRILMKPDLTLPALEQAWRRGLEEEGGAWLSVATVAQLASKLPDLRKALQTAHATANGAARKFVPL